MKPELELKKVKDGAHVLIVDPMGSNLAIYIRNSDKSLSLLRPKGRKLKKETVLTNTLPVSKRGEAAERRAAFVVYSGGRYEDGRGQAGAD
jgi:hypothetical protein